MHSPTIQANLAIRFTEEEVHGLKVNVPTLTNPRRLEAFEQLSWNPAAAAKLLKATKKQRTE